MSFRIAVDASNPGQFFACCGLLELAARLDSNVTGHFDRSHFIVHAGCTLTELLVQWVDTSLIQLEPENETSSPVRLDAPFHLVIDWWTDERAGGADLKVWAGRMNCVRIARAMTAVLRDPELHTEALFDVGRVVPDPADRKKKVEPFYFDSRRAPNAHSRDVGFSPDALELKTIAFPAVEALCFIGLQRCRPARADKRVFEYCTWATPLPVSVLAPIASGIVRAGRLSTYRFENWFRTGQKKHKAFRPAVLVK